MYRIAQSHDKVKGLLDPEGSLALRTAHVVTVVPLLDLFVPSYKACLVDGQTACTGMDDRFGSAFAFILVTDAASLEVVCVGTCEVIWYGVRAGL